MLSPALAVAPSPDSPTPHTSTRRRGLSYLRSLSSANNSGGGSSNDQPRISPRHFFARSTSYQETRNSRGSDTRRRSQSHSRPNDSLTSVNSNAPASTALERVATTHDPTSVEQPSAHTNNEPTGFEEDMARSRQAGTRRATDSSVRDAAPPIVRTKSGTAINGDTETAKQLPTIRLFAHQDNNRAGRQSLNFHPISRTLPSETSIIKVGRYSEREGPPVSNPPTPSDAPVGFKSKVVSRKHCEFSFVDGQWQVRDVASSSGTFLNHIRLSQPNQESRLYPVKDGDIIQLGIDFRGGEEMIFRCVKIRIECNRSWQKKPNQFNKSRQAQLRGLAKDQPGANANSGECSICLGNVLPCQCLFVAPCAHVWHYKCIRPLLEGRNSQYPQFQCPNCRAYTDLEADVDIDMDDWVEDSAEQEEADGDKADQTVAPPEVVDLTGEPDEPQQPPADPAPAPAMSSSLHPSSSSLLSRRSDKSPAPEHSATSNGIAMPSRPSEGEMQTALAAQQRSLSGSPGAEQVISGENPLTPRNNAGPFVFDGSGRTGSRRNLVPDLNIGETSDS